MNEGKWILDMPHSQKGGEQGGAEFRGLKYNRYKEEEQDLDRLQDVQQWTMI